MLENLSHFLDKVSSFLANRKGLLPLIGLVLILLNFILQFFLSGWFIESNLFLHLGLILAILGFMLAWAL
ncbi:MAG: hypothetical protein KatS3mg047_0633 [Bellilinea sp.]|nr:MAG: hypothetical protein KatS3mg047_0633 [Bellilinea sp.]